MFETIETDNDGLFKQSKIYIGRIENEYLKGRKQHKVYWGLYTLLKYK